MLVAGLLLGLANAADFQAVSRDTGQSVQRPVALPEPLPGRVAPRARPGNNLSRGQRPWYDDPAYRSRHGQSGYRGRTRCEAFNNNRQNCAAQTQNRVTLVRTNAGSAACVRGSSWGYDSRRIWVSRNCRATFAYGRGQYHGSSSSSRNNEAAWLIGGLAVGAGLAAILSQNGRNIDTSSSSSLPPAAVSADRSWVPAPARPALDQCLTRAARDVGVTGGTRVTLRDAQATEIGAGSYEIAATLVADYADGPRELPMLCEGNADGVDNLEFVAAT